MKWFWMVLCVAAIAAGYVYYGGDGKPKAPVKHEVRVAKGTLMSKTRDHEALWIHYKYSDNLNEVHEMSEKVPYIDLWEKMKVGDEIEILYDDQGLSVLKTVIDHARAQGQ